MHNIEPKKLKFDVFEVFLPLLGINVHLMLHLF